MRFLLDTNVVSDLRKRTSRTAALGRWFDGQPADGLFLSVVTIGEIRQGIEQARRRDRDKADALSRWLGDLVRHYDDRILPIDHAVAGEWGRLRVLRTVPVVDGFLAATAKVHRLTLATANERGFEGLGVPVFNPSNSAF